MIYFARIGEDGPIKIGTTISLHQRIKQLESEYGVRLTVLAVRDGGLDEENHHHEKFSHLRIGRSERFKPGDDLLGYIRDECRADDLLNALRESDEPNRKPVVLMMRGNPEYKGWLERFADSHGMSVSGVVDHAMRTLAKAEGFEPPPKR